MNKVQESKLENKPELGYMSVLPTETKIQWRGKKKKTKNKNSVHHADSLFETWIF